MELCCKCPNQVRADNQRYCNACHAEAEKRYRETNQEEINRKQREKYQATHRAVIGDHIKRERARAGR